MAEMIGSRKKSSWGQIALALCLVFAGGACSTTPETPQPIQHVVLMWLNHPDSANDHAQLFRAAHSLQMMPGVVRVDTGRTVPMENASTDRSFDLGVAITFRDRASLLRYEHDPRRAAALERYLRPLVQRFVVYNLGTR